MTFELMSGHPVTLSSWHIKLTIIFLYSLSHHSNILMISPKCMFLNKAYKSLHDLVPTKLFYPISLCFPPWFLLSTSTILRHDLPALLCPSDMISCHLLWYLIPLHPSDLNQMSFPQERLPWVLRRVWISLSYVLIAPFTFSSYILP